MIEWEARILNPGQPYHSVAPYGLAGQHGGVRMAVLFDTISPEHIIAAAQKIEFAIRLQLEAAEKKAKASKSPGSESEK